MQNRLYIAVRERSDRPGKWIVDVRRGPRRHPRTFSSEREARLFSEAVLRAEEEGKLKKLDSGKPRTLEALAKSFLEKKGKEGLRPKTLKVYSELLLGMSLPRIGLSKHPREVTQADLELHRDSRLKEVSPTTVVRELDRLKALFAHGIKLGVVEKNLLEEVDFPKVRELVHEWLRSTEIRPFLECCFGDWAAIAQFTLFTGLRRREIVFLQRSDVDLINNVVQVRPKPHLDFLPKNGKARSVPLDAVLKPMLQRHLSTRTAPGPGAFVFPQQNGDRRSETTRWFAVATQEAAARAGIQRPLTFHDLRRTYGAMLIESGVDIYTVSRLLGHSDVRITQKVYAPICGLFMASEQAKMGQYLRNALPQNCPDGPGQANLHPPCTQHPTVLLNPWS